MKKLNLFDFYIPDRDIDRKQFSLTHTIISKTRNFREAYAIALAAQLCHVNLDEYLNHIFFTSMKIFGNKYYESNLECFENYKNYVDIELSEFCTKVIVDFIEKYYLSSIDFVKSLIKHFNFAACEEAIAIEVAGFNFQVVVFANSDLDHMEYLKAERIHREMMSKALNESFVCVMSSLKLT
jgi:hypothetical protein